MIAELFIMGGVLSKIMLPLGVIGLIVQLVYPNPFTPYWADIFLIVVGCILYYYDFKEKSKKG